LPGWISEHRDSDRQRAELKKQLKTPIFRQSVPERRKKVELLNLILFSFAGWLVTDGYRGYLDRERRQRCLAHLIRKTIALTGALDQKAAKMGDWLLKE